MTLAIYHNPECETSRNTLAMIRQSGEPHHVVEYLKQGWTRAQLLGLFAAAGLTPRDALRVSKSPAEKLGLTNPAVSDEQLIAAMIEHPILVNRPIVCSPKGVRLCRPSELVLDLLENPDIGPFTNEDGGVVFDSQGKQVV